MKEFQIDQELIEKTVAFVQNELRDAEAGHDWWHVYRVWKNAQLIGKSEKVNPTIVELAALLHDIADAKFHGGNENIGPEKAKSFLESQETSPQVIEHVVQIIRHISFKNSLEENQWHSPELAVVRDADRLDAMGAIGIARAFHYGGFKNRPIYDPNITPNLQMTKDEYKTSIAPTINHFYEKLLLLKDLMHTQTGKALAEQRHAFMEQYLKQFYSEWEGSA